MKKILLLSLLIILSVKNYSQSKQDCKDFIKTNIESNSPLNNDIIYIYYGQEISKDDAEKFTGKNLSQNEYYNLLIINENIYTDEYKTKLYFQAFRICDLSGVSKVSINKKTSSKGVDYFEIHIYINTGYICTQYYIPELNKPENRKEISVGVKVDENTAKKIKKAIIALAKLYGSNSVIDGDELF